MNWLGWTLSVFAFIALLTAAGMVVAYLFLQLFFDVLMDAFLGNHD